MYSQHIVTLIVIKNQVAVLVAWMKISLTSLWKVPLFHWLFHSLITTRINFCLHCFPGLFYLCRAARWQHWTDYSRLSRQTRKFSVRWTNLYLCNKKEKLHAAQTLLISEFGSPLRLTLCHNFAQTGLIIFSPDNRDGNIQEK